MEFKQIIIEYVESKELMAALYKKLDIDPDFTTINLECDIEDYLELVLYHVHPEDSKNVCAAISKDLLDKSRQSLDIKENDYRQVISKDITVDLINALFNKSFTEITLDQHVSRVLFHTK